jgi:DNA topoisomerase-1
VLLFDGFLKVYADEDDEKEKKSDDDNKLQLLPPIEVGELVPKVKELLDEKKTKPPGRYTFGSLVKELEKLEIGRPSTYAAITKNITDRGYVREEKGKVVPLPPGEMLIDYLRLKHPWVIDYELTRKMEGFLDLVVENKESWQRFCKGVHNKMGYFVPPVRAANGGPSEAQLKFATDLAQKNSLVIPEETLQSGKVLSVWIADVVGNSSKPPAAGEAASQGKTSA